MGSLAHGTVRSPGLLDQRVCWGTQERSFARIPNSSVKTWIGLMCVKAVWVTAGSWLQQPPSPCTPASSIGWCPPGRASSGSMQESSTSSCGSSAAGWTWWWTTGCLCGMESCFLFDQPRDPSSGPRCLRRPMLRGVGEVLYLQPDTTILFSALRHALAKESLVGATALSDRGEIRTEEGLVKGHAYSVTGTHRLSLGFTKVKLIRLRNPWGQVEWRGPWSDSCPRWAALPEEWRDALLVQKEDGEFWMELHDFLKHFNTVQICSLSPEVLGPQPKGGGWHVHTFQGRWVRGFNAGGGQPGSETFWTNPQFQLTLQDPDEEEADDDERGSWGGWGARGAQPGRSGRHPKCTVLLSLIQRNRRRLRARGVTYLTVGFHVFRIPEELLGLQDSPRRRELLAGLLRADRSPFSIRRDVSRRCRLEPGHYLIVPSTAHAGEECDFMLRIFTERQHAATEIDNAVSADLQVLRTPSAPLEFEMEQLFQELAGEEEEIGVEQLQTLLSIALEPGDWASPWNHPPGEIGLRTCEHLMRCFGQGGHRLTLSEFRQLWHRLQEWQDTFNKFDADKSGTMNSHELRMALNSAGFQLNNQLTQLLTSRYRDSRLQVDLDRFLSCLAQLTCLFCHCSENLSEGEELIYMTKRQWMKLATFS